MSAATLERPAAPPRVEAAGRPARVCFLIDELAAAGTETQLLALIRRLDRRRVRPLLCLLRGASPTSRALEPDDCPVYRLGVGALRSPATLARAWRFVRLLRRERVDVVQTYFPDSDYFGLPLARLAGVPHRLRTRNNLGHWLTPWRRLLGRLFHGFATGVLTNCEAARRALVEADGVRPERVTVLENGVDLERFLSVPPLRRRTPDEPCRVGAVANLRRVKGLDVLVEAAGLLAKRLPGMTIEVAGEGEQRGPLERLAAQRGFAGRLRLCGSVGDIPGFLSRLDIAVLPSRSEGMSNALLEYMAAGRAVVASAVGAAPELIADGVHGLLVPPDDPPALAATLAALLLDPARARRLGEAARRRARERYSREAMVRRFEDFYQGLIARPRPHAT
jgi:glycosyltransferase involved in cell wall biosynthesis